MKPIEINEDLKEIVNEIWSNGNWMKNQKIKSDEIKEDTNDSIEITNIIEDIDP